MKTQYSVIVRRIVREDIVVEVMADSPKNAIDLAVDEATTALGFMWDCYDCEYFCDEGDVVKTEEPK